MRRGLLKDLGNTPTQMACGWRMLNDVSRLRELDGSIVVIDMLAGSTEIDGIPMSSPMEVSASAIRWMKERHELDGIPEGTVQNATLVLRPRLSARGGLSVECSTMVETVEGKFTSRDTAVFDSAVVRSVA